jgi:hypothetical protein
MWSMLILWIKSSKVFLPYLIRKMCIDNFLKFFPPYLHIFLFLEISQNGTQLGKITYITISSHCFQVASQAKGQKAGRDLSILGDETAELAAAQSKALEKAERSAPKTDEGKYF